MRARVSQAVLNRIARIEEVRSTRRPRAEFPPILDVDTWEAIAVPSQAALVAFTRDYLLGDEYRDGPTHLSPFDDVSYKYKSTA